MDSLFDKYRNEKLTHADLLELRARLDSLNDEEVARILDRYDSSDSEAINSFRLPDDVIERMRRRCFEKTGLTPAHSSRWMKRLLWAAAVIVPLLAVSTVYLFIESRDYRGMTETDIAIMTGEGERVTTQLPDGTRVELNYLSQLHYTLLDFNQQQRRITFNGEAFFDVVKNDKAPFTISSKGLEVVVRGTVFNLQARATDKFAELYLEDGRVDLKSRRQSVKLSSGQLARLNYATGSIEVSHVKRSQQLTWRTGDILFHNESLDKVIETLIANYGYNITIDTAATARNPKLKSRFTGRIPTNDLNEALAILEYAYSLRATINDNNVTLRPR